MMRRIALGMIAAAALYVGSAWLLAGTNRCLSEFDSMSLTCSFGVKLRFNPWP